MGSRKALGSYAQLPAHSVPGNVSFCPRTWLPLSCAASHPPNSAGSWCGSPEAQHTAKQLLPPIDPNHPPASAFSCHFRSWPIIIDFWYFQVADSNLVRVPCGAMLLMKWAFLSLTLLLINLQQQFIPHALPPSWLVCRLLALPGTTLSWFPPLLLELYPSFLWAPWPKL